MGEGYTLSVLAPTPRRLFLSFIVVAVVLFLRPPSTNFIFDEQEALLGNPYLQAGSPFWEAMVRDFWGRSAEQTIGAYRPLPNLLWRPFAGTIDWHTPWVFCFLNLVLHAATASVLSRVIARFLENEGAPAEKKTIASWAGGFFFLVCATSAEAVCSAVGVADILVGFFSALCLWLVLRRTHEESLWSGARFFALVTLFSFLGLLSKETMVATLLCLPLCALLVVKPQAGRRCVVLMTLGASTTAIVAFAAMRKLLFLSKKAEISHLVPDGPLASALGAFFSWFSQPKMPVDALNNPLLEASNREHLTTTLAMLAEQLAQIFLPLKLYADYSYPRQSLEGWSAVSIAGALILFCAVAVALWLFVRTARRKPPSGAVLLTLVGALLMVGSYIPVSNMLVLLPTIRADRLLYSPTLGAALVFAGVTALKWPGISRYARFFFIAYLCFQGVQARVHALIYSDDLSFWRATSRGANASAKSLLNMGVMVGARGDETARISYSEAALQRAPRWPMGHVYLGDAYCRQGNIEAAYPHFRRGFDAAPQSKALTALGLQCLWEKGGFSKHRGDLLNLAAEHPDTWLDYFVAELAVNGERHGGVPEQYRPRKYNARAVPK